MSYGDYTFTYIEEEHSTITDIFCYLQENPVITAIIICVFVLFLYLITKLLVEQPWRNTKTVYTTKAIVTDKFVRKSFPVLLPVNGLIVFTDPFDDCYIITVQTKKGEFKIYDKELFDQVVINDEIEVDITEIYNRYHILKKTYAEKAS